MTVIYTAPLRPNKKLPKPATIDPNKGNNTINKKYSKIIINKNIYNKTSLFN